MHMENEISLVITIVVCWFVGYLLFYKSSLGKDL